MVEYGAQEGGRVHTPRGLGDPVSAGREKRPTTRSLSRWTADLAGRPEAVAVCGRVLEGLLDEDLATWGFSRRELEQELASVDGAGPARRRRKSGRYALERALLVRLRRNIHHNAFGRLVKRLRAACDVLLR
jgi:hypothetical protein